jgi:hypothetical protein
MSYLGTREDAIRDSKAVCKYDNAMDGTSPVLNGSSDGGGEGPKEEFKPRTYTLGKRTEGMRREYK